MEEDVGVKVTVTRLRRRLSVEKTEDVSSPSTPTKKRGGRLAAKPQLELIDENSQISSPKKTRRKSLAKDVAEADEKPVTPSRRSTRIKSNTSIVSETVSQTTDSPRARRALRRNSQAGSDNEGPATPARQIRRTRKDSASSVENQEPAPSRPLQVAEMVIAEEPETESANKSRSSLKAATEELSPNSPRKSRRLLEKRNRRSGSYRSDHDLSTSMTEKTLNTSAKDDDSEPKTNVKTKSQDRLNKSEESKEIAEQLSESNKSLLKTLDTQPKINTPNLNKSVPSIDDKKKRRNRTESWPVMLTSPANENIMLSDNEQSKKKKKKSGNNFSWMNNSESSLNNTSLKENKNKSVQNDNDDLQTVLESPSKRKKRKSESSFSKEVENQSELVQLTDTTIPSEQNANKSITSKSENKIEVDIKDSLDNSDNSSPEPENKDVSSDLQKFFEKAPSNVQAIVYFDDSDSNSIATATKPSQQLDSEDQCVPVVKHDISPLTTNIISNSQENIITVQVLETKSANETSNQDNNVNNSCEPMDIDETIHEEILQKSNHLSHTSIVEPKSPSQRNSISEDSHKSKRKSSITANDTSKIENKSTLILSQLKDVSKASDNTQSPKPSANEILSKSTTNVHDDNKKVAKGNLSLNDLKGTPLKQIKVQKLNMQTSTPIATQEIEKTKISEEKIGSPKKNNSNFSESIGETESSAEDPEEESGEKSNLIDDEAEEASDDYESGDSRDDEERQYEDEHEIVERGETLGSDEDLTNDSDYEKDSFIVSSDAEDNELLSGSGDDLSMSDKELSMSKKSKDKYNERKSKEQKNVSREMFESRHQLSTSDKKSPALKTKINRMRIDSSVLESDEEILIPSKKSNRLRLDSTLDNSQNDDASGSLNKSNKKSKKSLQKSIHNESVTNEKEISVCNESVINSTDPLQVEFKQEPKTPQKDLDMSVVQFTSSQEIENVEVDEGKTILNQTGVDPLEATIGDENTSDSSENEEIMQNYDSVLNLLNKNKKGKLNTNNLSLNMDKKAKKNKKEPILDQLNLTQTKKSKKTAKMSQDGHSKTPEVSKAKLDSDDASNSSTIDLPLLFSEDNCASGDERKNKSQKEDSEDEEMFVPLRKSTGKTNIGENDNLFFIDTTGAQDSEKEDDSKLAEAPVEVLFSNKKKQKKDKLDSSERAIEISENAEQTETESPKKKKKQKNRHSSILDQTGEDTITNESSNKHKSIDAGLSQNSATEVPYNDSSDVSPTNTSNKYEKASNLDASLLKSEQTSSAENGSSKKKKKKKRKQSSALEQSVLFDDDSDDAPEETPYRSEKAADLSTSQLTPENTEMAEPSSDKKKKRKHKKQQAAISEQPASVSIVGDNANSSSKKRKRKSSASGKTSDSAAEDAQDSFNTMTINEPSPAGGEKKKRKISHRDESIDQSDILVENEADGLKQAKKKKKKNREINFQSTAREETETSQPQIKKNKKRKERDEDTVNKHTKVSKENSLHEVHMPPLPDSILSQLDDKPRKKLEAPKVISTSNFVVENARQKRAKPSKYLEESIYLGGNSPLSKKDKPRMKKPKVLPFIPTASISDSGFTTNFQIKKMPQNVEFVAGQAEITFSKETYLQKKGIKRLGTFDHYKKQLNRKISKF